MNDETARRLVDAQADEAAARTEVHEQERSLLAQITAGLHDHVDTLARKVCRDQPDAARELGRDGIAALRAALAECATRIAAAIMQAPEAAPWPVPRYEPARIDRREVQLAMGELLRGAHTTALAQVFQDHGFDPRLQGPNRRQRIVTADALYDAAGLAPAFAAVAAAINNLHSAARAAAQAKTAHDVAEVDALWDG